MDAVLKVLVMFFVYSSTSSDIITSISMSPTYLWKTYNSQYINVASGNARVPLFSKVTHKGSVLGQYAICCHRIYYKGMYPGKNKVSKCLFAVIRSSQVLQIYQWNCAWNVATHQWILMTSIKRFHNNGWLGNTGKGIIFTT